ncbi:programmed cell death protein 2 [Exophiala viscosa]|uniref:Programmed cell death protein 2 n=1 Tax=Exophiala viscosa TaxID=2486360 RepID=A0AAN6IBG8_9EURO|nr:programmed cell death protein 2 [Exophiala viscosa]
MPPYESDSSSDDGEDYSTTNVTLGYASADSTGDDVSHLGGYPTWLDAKQTPSAALSKCKVCNGYMSLLLQLNADLQQYFPHDERRLHVLSCRKKTCSKKIGSVRAFREVRKGETREKKGKQPEQVETKKATQDLGAALFGGSGPSPSMNGANPFSTSSTSTQSQANPFSSLGSPSGLAAKPPQRPGDEIQPPTESFADKLRITTKPESSGKEKEPSEAWPDNSQFPPAFTSFYLDAYPEELEKEQATDSKAESSKIQYDTEEGGSGAGFEKDTFESSLDKTFQKFSDRVAQNPEQVLRYEFKGEPLLYSGSDGVASRFVVPHGKSGAVRGMPRCESCGAQRAFELQLVPGLIYELEKDEAMDLEDGMEWGTVIVGTCVNNCGVPGQVSFREEWVGVQWEERVAGK